MQCDLVKPDSNKQIDSNTSQHPSMDHSQVEIKNVFLTCQKPLHSSQCIQPPINDFNNIMSDVLDYEQPPPYSQLTAPILPNTYFSEKDQMIITMTYKLRKFLLISGIFYFIWSILAIGLAVTLSIISYNTLHYGLCSMYLLLNGAINMYFVLFWIPDAIKYLMCLFSSALFLYTTGFILLVINCSTSITYLRGTGYTCDEDLTSYLQLVFVFILLLAAVHSFINLVVTWNVRNRILLTPSLSTV